MRASLYAPFWLVNNTLHTLNHLVSLIFDLWSLVTLSNFWLENIRILETVPSDMYTSSPKPIHHLYYLSFLSLFFNRSRILSMESPFFSLLSSRLSQHVSQCVWRPFRTLSTHFWSLISLSVFPLAPLYPTLTLDSSLISANSQSLALGSI